MESYSLRPGSPTQALVDRGNVGTDQARSKTPPDFLPKEEAVAMVFVDLSEERQF